MKLLQRCSARLFASLLFVCPVAIAAPGDLDGSFGAGGVALDDPPHSNAAAYDMVVQPDGRILVVSGDNFRVLRFEADGNTLDTSFGNQGVATLPGTGELTTLILQAGGDIVVAGRQKKTAINDYDFVIARLLANGTADPNFGSAGKVVLSRNKGDYLNALAIDPDNGSIYAAGFTQPNVYTTGNGATPVLVHVSATGVADTAFGAGGYGLGTGVVEIPLSAFNEGSAWTPASSRLRDIAIGSNGKLYVAGGTSTLDGGGKWSPLVARFTKAGVFDMLDGAPLWKRLVLNTVTHENSSGSAMALQPDGDVIVAGGTGYKLAVHGLNADLAYNTANFGVNGRTTIDITDASGEGSEFAVDVLAQPNGKIVLSTSANFYNGNGGINGLIVRLTEGGLVDSSFSGNGNTSIDLSLLTDQPDGFLAVAMRNDGDLVVAGGYDTDAGIDTEAYRIALARYIGDRGGMPDMACGTTGIIGIPGWNHDVGRAVVTQADNKFVVIGSDGGLVTRYNANGTLDTGFGVNGWGQAPLNRALAGAVQADGKLVVVGSIGLSGSEIDMRVVRLLPNGMLDPDFGITGPGYTTISFGSDGDYAQSVVVEPNGNITVAGFTNSGGVQFALARLTPLGALDGGFGNGGKLVSTEIGTGAHANDIALQADGKYVVAGYSFSGGYRYSLARYTTTGALDTTFGDINPQTGNRTGIVHRTLTTRDKAFAVEVQPNGRIVLAGQIEDDFHDGSFGVMRFYPNGTNDTTFDGDGVALVSTDVFDGSTYDGIGLVLQADGKMLVAGSSAAAYSAGGRHAVVFRLLASGGLDATFSGDGIVTVDPSSGTGHDSLSSIALRPDGRIVAVGTMDGDDLPNSNGTDMFAMCLHP